MLHKVHKILKTLSNKSSFTPRKTEQTDSPKFAMYWPQEDLPTVGVNADPDPEAGAGCLLVGGRGGPPGSGCCLPKRGVGVDARRWLVRPVGPFLCRVSPVRPAVYEDKGHHPFQRCPRHGTVSGYNECVCGESSCFPGRMSPGQGPRRAPARLLPGRTPTIPSPHPPRPAGPPSHPQPGPRYYHFINYGKRHIA